MAFCIEAWIKEYIEAVEKQFKDRIWFIGLQGSYGRGEATDQSDIDMVLILDQFSIDDAEQYRILRNSLPDQEKICGFVSGKEELLLWEPSELFQFYYDTLPIRGTLDALCEKISEADIWQAVRTGACSAYHMCLHNMIHDRSVSILRALLKSVRFTLQAIAYLNTGQYEKKAERLLTLLSSEDGAVLRAGMELPKLGQSISSAQLQKYSALLIEWASNWMRRSAEKLTNKASV